MDPATTHVLPLSAEFVAVSGFVLLSAFLTAELRRGPQSPARRALAAFTGVVLVNRAAPEAALVFSCAGRHAWLGTQIGREHGLLQEHVGDEVPAAGFYTFGEICPLPGSPTPYTHGSTFVTVLIGEEA